MTAKAPAGRIVTFYSYKGGTGRSMMLANCAWLLATAGHRVLVVDWDLEAPGLQRYFAPFLTNPQLTDADGLIDLVMKYSAAAVDPLAEKKARPSDWYYEYADVLDYAISINWKFPKGGSLSLLPSGRQGPTYGGRVNSFSWQHFYDKLGGHALFEALKQSMRQFDFVLIDSRTGVSDTAGITTVQFPDSLVVLFTLNNQSIDGASAITRSVMQQQKAGFTVFPVPTRVDNSESDKLNARWRLALKTFDEILGKDSPTQRRDYWDDIAVPYMPKFAYEELLAPFANHVSDPAVSNLLKVAVRVVKTVFDVRVEPEDYAESVRQNALDHYAGRAAALTPAEAQRAAEAERAKVEARTRSAVDQARTEVQAVARKQQRWTYAAVAVVVLVLGGFFTWSSMQKQAKQANVAATVAESVIAGDRAAQAGNFREALDHYNTAEAADPTNPAVLSGRADVFIALKDPASALNDLNRAIEVRPENQAQRLKRAGVLSERGDLLGAWADYRRVISSEPGSADAQTALEALKSQGIDPYGRVPSAPPTLYIQYAYAGDQAVAQEVASGFASTQVKAEPIERREGVRQAEVRYFFPDDADIARQVQLTAESVLKSKGYDRALTVTLVQAAAKSGNVELWLPRLTPVTLSTAKVEVFWCETSGPGARELATRIVALKPSDATGRWKTEQLSRAQAERPSYRLMDKSEGYEIGAEPGDEIQIAQELNALITKSGRLPPFMLREVTTSTPDYLSVFVCPRLAAAK